MVTHSAPKFSNSCRITLFLQWSEAYWINFCWILSFKIFLSSVPQNQSPCILLFLSHPSLISILLLLVMGGFVVCAISYSGSVLDLYHVSGTWRYAFISLSAPTWLQLWAHHVTLFLCQEWIFRTFLFISTCCNKCLTMFKSVSAVACPMTG